MKKKVFLDSRDVRREGSRGVRELRLRVWFVAQGEKIGTVLALASDKSYAKREREL